MAGFEVLERRGFVSQCSNTEELRKLFDNERVTFYIGFDPTGKSLHVGHLVQLFAMAHLQKAGHRPIVLIGGGTARIGDPSGKTEMRKILPIETIKENGERFRKQISHFISFEDDRGIMDDNANWLADLNYIDFLREIGKHFSVNRMLSFETYKMRLERGLSFIEFNYQILQAYDYLVLYRKYGCKLQMGGDDQWGNIVAGIDLIRRIEGVEVFALTSPLVTRSDGKKMGKTEKGALFLDPEMTKPYDFYQYWINVPDADVKKLLYLFTFLPEDEVEKLGNLKDREINRAKEVLAYELTKVIHGEEEAKKARDASKAVFGKAGGASLDAIPSKEMSLAEFENGVGVVDLFASTSLCSSKSDARRLITQGGAYINDENIRDIEAVIGKEKIRDNQLLLRAGKKRYFRIVIK